MKKRKILVLVGPTASGKTTLSLSIAKELGSEIISADSRQVYRHLNIGTAKPTPEELAAVPHHFIDILDPKENYSAGSFGIDARKTIEEIHYRNHHALVVGGSGLYVRALINGFFSVPATESKVRLSLIERLN